MNRNEQAPPAFDEGSDRDKARRRLILESAGRLFYRYGFRKTSLDDIARECRISKKTLYRYFDGKKDLVEKVITTMWEDMLPTVKALYRDFAPPGFTFFKWSMEEMPDTVAAPRTIRARFELMSELSAQMQKRISTEMFTDLRSDYPDLWRWIGRPFVEMFEDILRRGQREGDVRPDVNPKVVVRIMELIRRYLITPETVGRIGFSLEDATRTTWALFDGILTEQGRSREEG